MKKTTAGNADYQTVIVIINTMFITHIKTMTFIAAFITFQGLCKELSLLHYIGDLIVASSTGHYWGFFSSHYYWLFSPQKGKSSFSQGTVLQILTCVQLH